MANSKGPKRGSGSKPLRSSKAATKETENTWTSIPIDRPFPIPPDVKEVLARIDGAGHVGYLVGGSVRDFLLKRPSKDHDIATSATPDELIEIFPRALTIGKAFGVIQLPQVQVSTFRKDLEYQDHRHPTRVKFSSPEEDALRRDFTVNAFYYDPKTHKILDYVGGYADLKAGVIRAIGDPSMRFREDALRLLRAIRFQAQLGFTLDPETATAIQTHAKLITAISAERIRDELTWMWQAPMPHRALQTLQDFQLLEWILPEMTALKGVSQPSVLNPQSTSWDHTIRMLEWLGSRATKRSVSTVWAAVLWGVGKPVAFQRNRGEHLNGQEIDGASLAKKIGRRLRLSHDEIELVSRMIGDQFKFREVFNMRESTLQRWIREGSFSDLLELHQADALTTDGNLVHYEFCKSRYQQYLEIEADPMRLLTGADLIQLGFSPGPRFSEILRTVEDLFLEKRVTTKEQALEFVIKHFVD